MDHYGLIGKSLKHSFSQNYFSKKISILGINASYENLELENISAFKKLIHSKTYHGLNVTIPYKESILPLLDELDEEAKNIGAVNTIKFQNGKTKGYNTDVYGFKESLHTQLFQHKHAMILGTGGAEKAVSHVLKSSNIDVITISRDKGKGSFIYEHITPEILRKYTLIVNTTPLGMFPEIENYPALPYEAITNKHLLYDLIYNPKETKFLQFGKSFGAQTMNGLKMLELQAEKSWEIWND